jgi:hypothetical protein
VLECAFDVALWSDKLVLYLLLWFYCSQTFEKLRERVAASGDFTGKGVNVRFTFGAASGVKADPLEMSTAKKGVKRDGAGRVV